MEEAAVSGSHRSPYLAFCLALLFSTTAWAKPPRLDRRGDPLPPGAVVRLGSTRLQLLAGADEVTLSADGKLVAAATRLLGARIRVWEAATGRLVCEIKPKGESGLSRLRFSRDGRYLAADWGKAVVVWETVSGRAVRRFGGFDRGPIDLFFSSNRKALVGAWCQDNVLGLWDVHSEKLLRRLDLFAGRKPRLLEPGEPEERLAIVAVSSDSRTVAYQVTKMTFSDREFPPDIVPCEKSLYVMDIASGKQRRLLQGKSFSVNQNYWPLRFSPDGKLLAVGEGGSLTLFEVVSGKPVYRPQIAQPFYVSFAFSGDGKMLAVCRDARSIDVRDTTTWKLIRHLPTTMHAQELSLCGNGSILAVTQGCAVRLWNVNTGKELLPLPGHNKRVQQVAFSTDGDTVWSASEEVICRWDRIMAAELSRTRPPRTRERNDRIPYCLRAGLKLEKAKGQFQLLGLHSGKLATSFHVQTSKYVEDCFFADNGKVIGVGVIEPGYTLHLRDTTTGKEVGRLTLEGRPFNGDLTSPDGNLLLWEDGRCHLRVWNIQAGKEMSMIDWGALEYDQLGSPIVACSPDGRTLATVPLGEYARHEEGSKQARIRFWRASTGKQIGTSDRFPGDVPFHGFAFSPDARMLATGDVSSPVIRLWEVATGKLRAELKGHEGNVHCVAFSPDGRWLASGSKDTTVLIWDLRRLPEAARQR
jgi:WD40 repeat protein